ncbi:MAG: Holliday junction branch migration protein RuvA [Flavobacteriales bacterium]|nr:Holliday junction branch migration protein RuvA [Flavobacteriales bacterium]
MYEFIEGKLEKSTPAFAVINCNGVGYHINISVNTFEKIKDLQQCKLLVHQIVSEDNQALFGFFKEMEREVFRMLISVSGVGANTARVLLSSLNEDSIVQAILRKDAALLQSVKGIGPKAAQRLILELYDKAGKLGTGAEIFNTESGNIFNEALQAMQALGYSRMAAEKALARVQKEQGDAATTESLVKLAFKYL